MAAHSVAGFNFNLWDGDPPSLAKTQVELCTRPGTWGHSELLLGRWGATFRARLSAFFPSYAVAMNALPLYMAKIGTGVVPIKYNNLILQTVFKTGYTIETIEFVDCHALVAVMGPGFIYPNGAKLITEWTMTPIDWNGNNVAKKPAP